MLDAACAIGFRSFWYGTIYCSHVHSTKSTTFVSSLTTFHYIVFEPPNHEQNSVRDIQRRHSIPAFHVKIHVTNFDDIYTWQSLNDQRNWREWGNKHLCPVYTKSFTSFVNSTQAMHAFRPSSHTKTSDLVERILFSYIGRASCCPFHSSHFNISKRVDCIDPLHIAVNQLRAPSETILVRNSEAGN